MNKTTEITLLATKAVDRLVDESGKLLEEKPGGPALFIRQAFQKTGISFTEINPETLMVEILITKAGEFGRVPNPVPPLKVDAGKIKTPAIMLSAVANEIDLKNIEAYPGDLFVDVQGFVRDPSAFGQKQPWDPEPAFLEKISCLKATEEELKFISPAAIKALKSKMLLVTQGQAGSTLYSNNKEFKITPPLIIKTAQTIGAGDTLFATFVGQLIRGKTSIESLKIATQEAALFLSADSSSNLAHLPQRQQQPSHRYRLLKGTLLN